MKMRVLVVANGDIADDDWLRAEVARAGVVIAADGGAEHLGRIGVRPSLLVGDMDSLDEGLPATLAAAGVAVHRYPTDKDETDLELALRFAVELGDGAIAIAGALGGRLDQTLGNLFLLAHPMLAGRDVTIVDPWQTAWLVSEMTTIEGAPGDRVSLLPLGADVFIAASTGLRWPLVGTWLHFGAARGVSNRMVSERATLSGVLGRLVVVHSPGKWTR